MNWFPQPQKIIRRERATIVLFTDGTRSVVRLQDGDTDDPYVAVCIAIAKRFAGSGTALKRLVHMAELEEQPKPKKAPKESKPPKYHLPFLPFDPEELFTELFERS